ncbi:uncharacterized protein LOC121046238 [Ixodes scapularis]|uniref:uncharacterized protein LOC121046238 n=1 Tax=Ixodes scapularis TaxID=6945 RepID=UPI001C392D45|nr:uncharacterized protein LOC121046238 [Ixodes scapularis]
MEARAETECTYTDSSFISLMQMHTELMTDSVRSRCSQKSIDLNVLLKCSQAEALKKMLLCGLSYNKLLEDQKKQGEFYVTPTTCSYLAEFQHCMIEVERSTGCTKSELHLHTSTVLNFWTWNVAPLCESAASLLLNDVDPKCDFPKSIHKALMCGKEFQEYAEQATWESMTFSQSCSSLETFDKCLQRALEVRQCKHSLGAQTQISLIKSMLRSEYKISCTNMYQSAPGPPGERSDEYLLSDYNYYFGEEIARTEVTDKHIEGFAEDDARRRGIPFAKRARSHLMDKLARPLRDKIKTLGFKNVMNIAKKRLIGLTEVLTSTPVQSNSSNSSNEISSTPSSVIVVPVVENDDSLCDMTAYEKESQRCNRYISEQAKSYRKNLKYVPSANSKGLTESVCKMAEHYRVCLSDVAERHRCLIMLARTPRKVEKSLAKVGLAFCSSTATDSGSSLRRSTSRLTLVLIVGICWKFKALN